jgi:hypothetical protein
MTKDTVDGTAMVQKALVIGQSQNAEDATMQSGSRGIISARTENFQIHDVKFFNFAGDSQAAFGTCSHCFHPAATDSGARTITLS